MSINTSNGAHNPTPNIHAVGEAARQAHKAGLCILRTSEDGKKRPWLPDRPPDQRFFWGAYKTERPTDIDIENWFGPAAHPSGYGMVSGAVSGHRETWDFDCRAAYDKFCTEAMKAGLGDVVARIEAGLCDDTAGGGVRWIVEYDPTEVERKPGDRIVLARRPKTADELAQAPNGSKVKTLIEMPAYSILAPTNGTCHPSGRAYTRRSGHFSTIAKYSAEEREALMDLARGQDEIPREEHKPFTNKSSDGTRPGDVFARANSWADILEPVGWKKLYTHDGVTYWRRPGKTFGQSATTNYKGADLLYVFTSSTEFAADKSYGKFAAHTVIHHGGDFSKAASELAKLQKKAKVNEGSTEPGPDGKPTKKSRLQLIPFKDIKLDTGDDYLIEDAIPREGVCLIWGEPKCGKSFWTFDATMHIALGWEYRGRQVEQGAVVYCAFEGQRGFTRRIEAFRQNKLSEDADIDLPFYLEPVTMDLINEHEELIAIIGRQLNGGRPAAIVLDTLNRSLFGSESSDEDMGKYIRAADALREAFGCVVIIVHHCGHEAKRPRGHSSLIGAADAIICVRRAMDSKIITTEVERLKDGQEGTKFFSTLETVEVGISKRGKTITSCFVASIEASEASVQAAPEPKLTSNQRTMFGILHAAGKSGLTLDEWNEKSRTAGIGVKRKATLHDIRTELKAKKLVHEWNGRWVADR
jgi:hypothetical protein